jgi:hypothetical protein
MGESMFPPHEIFDFAGTPGVFSASTSGFPA